MPASATAAQYAGRSSPNLASQVAARQAKNARVSVRYHEPRAASGAATRLITGQSMSCRSITMSARSSRSRRSRRPGPRLPSLAVLAVHGEMPAAWRGPQEDRHVRGPGRGPASPGPGARARPASRRAGRRRAPPGRPGRRPARAGTGRAGAPPGCRASPPTGAGCCRLSAPARVGCWADVPAVGMTPSCKRRLHCARSISPICDRVITEWVTGRSSVSPQDH